MSCRAGHSAGCRPSAAALAVPHGSPCEHSLVENQLAGPGEAEPIELAAVQDLHLVAAPQERFGEEWAAPLSRGNCL